MQPFISRAVLTQISILFSIILLTACSPKEDERKIYMKTIFNNTERLKNLVSELFELSKLEA
ncbi:MAG: hypothetical protein ABI638_00600 [Ignavibacteriota bacterium]